MKPTDKPTTETIKVRHDFSDEEKLALAHRMSDARRTTATLQAELDSIKSDYKGKLTDADNQFSKADQKFRDGFEMREVTATVAFDEPAKGHKTYFWTDDEGNGCKIEPMTPDDIQRAAQRMLPLEEAKPAHESEESEPTSFPDDGEDRDPRHEDDDLSELPEKPEAE